jgi:diketogulonate reductase-like aldo/keto reductase
MKLEILDNFIREIIDNMKVEYSYIVAKNMFVLLQSSYPEQSAEMLKSFEMIQKEKFDKMMTAIKENFSPEETEVNLLTRVFEETLIDITS